MDEQSVILLNGYLHSLRRLSSNKCDFWAEVFNFDKDIVKEFEEYLDSKEISLLEASPIGRKQIEEILSQHLFSKIIVTDKDMLKLFAWDIAEYLQMSYQFIEPVINPIRSKESLLIRAKSGFHGDYIYIVVPIVNQAVAIGLATRK